MCPPNSRLTAGLRPRKSVVKGVEFYSRCRYVLWQQYKAPAAVHTTGLIGRWAPFTSSTDRIHARMATDRRQGQRRIKKSIDCRTPGNAVNPYEAVYGSR